MMEKYYDTTEDNAAFEKCIEVMSRLIMKYGSDLLAKMKRDRLKELFVMELEEIADRENLTDRYHRYCHHMELKLMIA